MYITSTNIQRVRAVYWDQGDEVIHFHVVTESGAIVEVNLFHTGLRPPRVEQVKRENSYNPAGKEAEAAAERFKKGIINTLDKGAGI